MLRLGHGSIKHIWLAIDVDGNQYLGESKAGKEGESYAEPDELTGMGVSNIKRLGRESYQ